MTHTTFFVKTFVPELQVLKFLAFFCNSPIDSLNHRNINAPIFFQFEEYNGEYKIMVSLSSSVENDPILDVDSISKAVSHQFKTEVIYELALPVNQKCYKRYFADGSFDLVDIEEIEDGFKVII